MARRARNGCQTIVHSHVPTLPRSHFPTLVQPGRGQTRQCRLAHPCCCSPGRSLLGACPASALEQKPVISPTAGRRNLSGSTAFPVRGQIARRCAPRNDGREQRGGPRPNGARPAREFMKNWRRILYRRAQSCGAQRTARQSLAIRRRTIAHGDFVYRLRNTCTLRIGEHGPLARPTAASHGPEAHASRLDTSTLFRGTTLVYCLNETWTYPIRAATVRERFPANLPASAPSRSRLWKSKLL
jgi:hypothetical protein